jgi:hypothetical protein
MKIVSALLPGAVGMLISMSVAAQGAVSSDEPTSRTGPPIEPTMMRVVRYPEEINTLPGCFRVGRCSAFDLFRFRDRPNWLTRLAPEVPAEPPSVQYVWSLAPVTPVENILPKYRSTSLVRDEYRAVGEALDGIDCPNCR